jgi:hypothetical protein
LVNQFVVQIQWANPYRDTGRFVKSGDELIVEDQILEVEIQQFFHPNSVGCSR